MKILKIVFCIILFNSNLYANDQVLEITNVVKRDLPKLLDAINDVNKSDFGLKATESAMDLQILYEVLAIPGKIGRGYCYLYSIVVNLKSILYTPD